MKKLKVGVIISGGGSNLQVLIDACKLTGFPAEIIHVISNIPDAYGLTRARNAGIATTVINHKDYDTRESFDADINQVFIDAGVEFICCAGFMRIMTDTLINSWPDRMINIHPSLLPKYKGLHTHQRALNAGDSHHGCTVHYVRVELDDGPLIVQASVPVLEGDDTDKLAKRVLKQEHTIYPIALKLIAENRVIIKDNIAFVDGKIGPLIISA